MGKRGRLRDPSKDRKVCDLFLSGLTQEKIGEQMGYTKQGISLILKQNGLRGCMGGVQLRTNIRERLESERRRKKFVLTHGITKEEFKIPKIKKLFRKYYHQRASARLRNIGWEFDFPEWLHVWEKSNVLPYRGRGSSNFCMARVGDDGPYRKDNVYICSNYDNTKDYWDNRYKVKKKGLTDFDSSATLVTDTTNHLKEKSMRKPANGHPGQK